MPVDDRIERYARCAAQELAVALATMDAADGLPVHKYDPAAFVNRIRNTMRDNLDGRSGPITRREALAKLAVCVV